MDLIVGKSERLDSPPTYNKKKKINIGEKELCFNWWKSYLLKKYFSSEDELFEAVGILICSEMFANQLVNEFGKGYFFLPNLKDSEVTELLSKLKV